MNMGGYYGGIPAFLVFAVVFTLFMFEGKTALVFTTLEIILYGGLYIFAFIRPEYVKSFPSQKNYPISNQKYTDYTKLPGITLNIKDKKGEYVTITPTAYNDFLKRWYKSSIAQQWTQSSSQSYASTWRIINPGDPYSYIQVPNALISSDGKSITYYYQAVPAHRYKLDFEEPSIDVDGELDGGVVILTANVDDSNLEGCYASFNISFNGKLDGTLEYKPSNSPEYDDNNWSQAGGTVSADEVVNSSVQTKTLPISYDTLSPRITLKKQYDIDGEKPYKNYAVVDVQDVSDTTVTYAWTDKGEEEPDNASYSEAGTEIRYTRKDLNKKRRPQGHGLPLGAVLQEALPPTI